MSTLHQRPPSKVGMQTPDFEPTDEVKPAADRGLRAALFEARASAWAASAQLERERETNEKLRRVADEASALLLAWDEMTKHFAEGVFGELVRKRSELRGALRDAGYWRVSPIEPEPKTEPCLWRDLVSAEKL